MALLGSRYEYVFVLFSFMNSPRSGWIVITLRERVPRPEYGIQGVSLSILQAATRYDTKEAWVSHCVRDPPEGENVNTWKREKREGTNAK